MKSMKAKKNIFQKHPAIGFILFGLLLALIPTLAEMGILKNGYVTTIGGTLIYAIAALGLNILLGWSGLISLGTAGFMGLAAYMSAYLTVDLNLPFEVSFFLAVLIPTLIGILVGLVSLKIEGLYLAIATLAVAEVLRKTFEELGKYTGGFSGKSADYPTLLGLFELDRTTTFYFIIFVLVIIMILTSNMMNGRLGRALNAMRGSEAAAQAMGVNLLTHRLIAFALATIFASVAGVLYVHFVKFSYPSTWSLAMSLNFLAIIIIGGLRSIYGTVLGAFIVYAVPDMFLKQIPFFEDLSYVLNGVLIILVIIFYPNGLISIGYDIRKLFRKLTKGGTKNE
ncbi:branched-chain amino acid ABC transporter permease [Proteiniclasticum sp. SCR006]|uniref:Branched-chain amino acid ABC transporter permease n=1 Tax=Proteiniclasticum aestuarii TaxID=2817862 RepID=A0A939KH29_9CLOT|nr:branched-chain amino acid ABC transporter permease [Proteiniclasticum aestuarii]MBO1265034.1 branched-chain amino acid ABC transporter permease [Proteiniclasticum aestuarii]